MKQNSLEKLLQQDAPPPNPAARLAARRAALEEFARVMPATAAPARRSRLQGLLGALRLSRNDDTSHGRDSMPWYSRRLVIGGAASAFIAVFGFSLVWNTYKQDPQITELEAPVAARTIPQPEVLEPQSEGTEQVSEAASLASESSAIANPVAQPADDSRLELARASEAKQRLA
jgi:hypothetical protein